MKKLFIILTLLSFICVSSFTQQNASEPQKFALVIGNGNYTSIAHLRNPIYDANDMEAVLIELGFTVDKILNGDLVQMEAAVINFRNQLSIEKNSYGFFYYAGHGVKSGEEIYLIPVTIDYIRTEEMLPDHTMSLQFIFDNLSEAGNELNIFVFDSFRDNPFFWARYGNRSLPVIRNIPIGSIIVFSNSDTSFTTAHVYRYDLLTSHLIKNLRIPGLEVKEVFLRTILDVINASSNSQSPDMYIRYFENAYLGSLPENISTD